MEFSVRVSRSQDLKAVDELLKASYPVLMASAYDPEALAPALKLMTRANPTLLVSGTYYVAESSSGLIVGCGGWTRERPGTMAVEGALGHVRHFGTHVNWARRGVGRAIYQLCEDAARAAGVKTLEACSSLNGENFYRALGFERVRDMDLELGPQVHLPAVLMRREI